jgi:hypothetical protein
MSQDWDIKPRGKECAACHLIFADRQAYYARLQFGKDGYERADFCEACWAQEVQAQTNYSMWKGIYRLPPIEPDRTIKRETAETLLRQLIAESNPARRKVIYILCVMLERQRLLIEREVRTNPEGERLVVYEHRKTGESFVIVDPQLKLSDLDQVQQEVLALLTGAPAESVDAEDQPVVSAPSSATV